MWMRSGASAVVPVHWSARWAYLNWIKIRRKWSSATFARMRKYPCAWQTVPTRHWSIWKKNLNQPGGNGMPAATKIKYLIIGNSAGGIGAAEAIRGVDAVGAIAIVSDEPYPAYSRPLISEYLAHPSPGEKMLSQKQA